jgi:hypothetical protein
MQKLLSKIDFTLAFRLILSAAMFYTGYEQNDKTTLAFGLFLAIYAIIGNIYKVGCGYNGCGYTPKYNGKQTPKQEPPIHFTEVK